MAYVKVNASLLTDWRGFAISFIPHTKIMYAYILTIFWKAYEMNKSKRKEYSVQKLFKY